MRPRNSPRRSPVNAAGFLIRGDDELRALQRFSVPEPGIKIEDTSCFRSEIWIPGKDPTPMLPRTKGIGTQPTPEGRTADLGDDTLGHHLPPDIGKRQPRERQPEAMGKLTGEGFYWHYDAGGKRGRDAPPRRFVKPGRRASGNRLRHLLTIWRGVSKRAPMTSLGRPCAAKSTILALITSRYGDVYFRTRASSSFFSTKVRKIRNGGLAVA